MQLLQAQEPGNLLHGEALGWEKLKHDKYNVFVAIAGFICPVTLKKIM